MEYTHYVTHQLYNRGTARFGRYRNNVLSRTLFLWKLPDCLKIVAGMGTKSKELAGLQCFSKRLSTDIHKNLVAHRGFHSPVDNLSRPLENTIEAFTEAWNAGFMCECDVTLTTDGKIVFGHDETFERLALVKNSLHTSNLEEVSSQDLQHLKLKDKSTALFIETVFSRLSSIHSSKLVIEIKHTASSPVIAKKIMENLKVFAKPREKVPLIMSFKPTTCFEIQKELQKYFDKEVKPLVMLLIKKADETSSIQKLKPVDPSYIVPTSEVDLSNPCSIEYIKAFFLHSNGIHLDGLYLQFDSRMLVDGVVRENLKTMCNEFSVGVWLGKNDGVYDKLTTASGLCEIGVSFVNSDLPSDKNYF